MNRLGSRLVAVITVAILLCVGPLVPRSVAQTPDQSEVVLVLDFSASILEDVANRGRFATALERIADRIDATSADLVAGDTTVSMVQFATRAADYKGCVNLKLLASPANVARFADCVRNVAAAYRKGLSPALTKSIGVDTNYVAAMDRAAAHLAAGGIRPALILFTDGKHDVAGVPVGRVLPERDKLFGDRSPFALLPVGMGLDPAERVALESGLQKLQVIRDMPACVSGTQFEWPQVVFESAAAAGNAVAIALQNVTCTFTVAPTPTPTPVPTPTPEPTPGSVRSLTLTPGDGRIELDWLAPGTQDNPIVDYQVRCRTGEGEWIESDEGRSDSTAAVIEGLTNGSPYECEVAAADATSVGDWEAAPTTATPVGRPPAPGKPVAEALDQGLRVQVPAGDPTLVTGYRYECSADQGTSWAVHADVAASDTTTAKVGGLTNGVEYVCRAFATNETGTSDASPVSDAVRPCGSLLDCSPVAVPILGGVGFVAIGGLLLALFALFRTRNRGYVVAVVDVVHTANLGYGSRLGLRFVRPGPRGAVTGIAADRSRGAEIRIRALGGDRFEVTDRTGSHIATAGQPIVAVDSLGVGHSLILRGFRTATASPASSQG